MNRKTFIQQLSSLAVGIAAPSIFSSVTKAIPAAILPPKLKEGDKVALISPAGKGHSQESIHQAMQNIRSLGFEPVAGKNLGQQWGYMGGRDGERVKDLHDAFDNPQIKAVMALRGGYGASRLLPLIDFDRIRKQPKIIIGYSDITSLLLAIHQETGLVTFHGPNASDFWTPYARESFKQLLMAGPGYLLTNHKKYAPKMLVRGAATGRLVGGNLSLLTQSMGTPWEIQTRDNILFIEETNESAYRIDRMLTHLWLARKLQQAKGFIVGQITGAEDSAAEMSWENVFYDRLKPLGKPCLMNISAGHIQEMMTLPMGATVRLDASRKRIELLSAITQKKK